MIEDFAPTSAAEAEAMADITQGIKDGREWVQGEFGSGDPERISDVRKLAELKFDITTRDKPKAQFVNDHMKTDDASMAVDPLLPDVIPSDASDIYAMAFASAVAIEWEERIVRLEARTAKFDAKLEKAAA